MQRAPAPRRVVSINHHHEQADARPPPPPLSPPPPHIRHPTPDWFSLTGACPRNISRLERSAEELSQAGSDIASEIRRMNDADKDRSQGSRRTSLQSDAGNATPGRRSSVRSWTGTQETGGDSGPHERNGGRLVSPTGSMHHGSISLRIAPLVEPIQEGRPLDSPLAPSSASIYSLDRQLSRRTSQSSQARRMDHFAMQLQERFDAMPTTHEQANEQPLAHEDAGDPRPSTDTYQEAEMAFQDFDGVHYNPDTEEFVELDVQGNEVRRVSARASSASLLASSAAPRPMRARPVSYAMAPPPTADMVYYPAPVPRMLNLPKRLSQLPSGAVQAKRRSQMLDQLSPAARQSATWLPAPTLPELEFAESDEEHRSEDQTSIARPFLQHRVSVGRLDKVPPQLRASVYFEHQPVAHDVEIQSESAVATLDNILTASANAPVSVFTDHPYAGDVRASVYAPAELRTKRSTVQLGSSPYGQDVVTDRHTRSSSVGRLFRRSTGDLLGGLRRPGSRASMLTDLPGESPALRKRSSRLSLGDELTQTGAAELREDGEEDEELERPHTDSGLVSHAFNAQEFAQRDPTHPSYNVHPAHRKVSDNDEINADFREAEEDDVEGEPIYVQPSTLLAELQVRKAQQKSRSRTAAVAFPNGMRSTLLQLDAVEEVRRNKRKNNRVALAWEDPAQQLEDEEHQGEDDDVPLGMLFPRKDGKTPRGVPDARDWNRPLGLMEQRALEDSEPLSRRRNRLRGYSPPRVERRMSMAANVPRATAAAIDVSNPELDVDDEHEHETLGTRTQRLKTKSALDQAISDIAPTTGERPISTFTDELLGQLGELGLSDPNAPSQNTATQPPPPVTPAPEDETLGQRRARLQRERAAAGTGPSEPTPTATILRQSPSLANLLASHPVGMRPSNKTYTPAAGTLLHTSVHAQSQQSQALRATNLRSATFGPAPRPLLAPGVASANPSHYDPARASSLLAGLPSGRPANGAFAPEVYNPASGAAGVYQPSSSADFPSAAGARTSSLAINPHAYAALTGPPAAPPQPQRPPLPTSQSQAYVHLTQWQLQMQQQLQLMQQQQQQWAFPQHPTFGMGMGPVASPPLPGAAFSPMGAPPPHPSQDPAQQLSAIDQWRMGVALQ